MPPPNPERLLMHASAVAVGPLGVLVTGPSGSGKSAMALELMSRGATLVSDDQTWLTKTTEDAITLTAPPTIRGQIEARFLGILTAETQAAARLHLVVDLESTETDRLPQRRHITLLGAKIALVHKVESSHFPAALMQYLKGGRIAE